MVLIEKLSSDPVVNVAARPNLNDIYPKDTKLKLRLHDMFYKHGPANGTMLSLPFDQLVEHGIGHSLVWDRCADPGAVIELGDRGDFSALVLPIGTAEKYISVRNDTKQYQRAVHSPWSVLTVPLIVKVDGHPLVGKEVRNERHSTISSIERAFEAGADAIGTTLYVGGEEMEYDYERVSKIIEQAHNYELPVFVWAYARGPLAGKMGEDSLFWCAQGVALAEAIGADVVKQKFPMPTKNKEAYVRELSKYVEERKEKKGYFYSKMPDVEKLLQLEPADGKMTDELAVRRLAFMAAVAPKTLKIISGGSKSDEESLLRTLKIVMDSGNEGQIVGRNLWGRPIEEALALKEKMYAIMKNPVYKRD